MRMIHWKSAIPLFIIAGFYSAAIAQTDKELLARVAEENQKAVEALVMYPADTRIDILESALYPEALIKMENIQAETAAAFKKALDPYPQETQSAIWDITRYPDLLRQLTNTTENGKAALEKILAAYPAEVRENAVNLYMDYPMLLKRINSLDESAASAFSSTIEVYPLKTQRALRNLLNLPEVLSLLTENIRLTILAGDMYRKEPDWTLFKVDSLSNAVARRNARELADWKKSLEENPQAKSEMEAAANAYAEENGDAGNPYEAKGDDLYYDESAPEPAVHITETYYYHYPYWFGYPWWYDYPRWRPYPWWWDWGFYYGPSHTVVIIGLPSYHFIHWYFYHPWHHDRWCRLSGHFIRHYHHYRESGGSISTGVEVWQRRHGTLIDGNWLRDDGRLETRLREYGRLEAGRAKYNRDNPARPLNERDYLERYPGRFPEMSKQKPQSPASAPGRLPTLREQDLRNKPKPEERKQEPAAIPDRDRKKLREPSTEVKPKPGRPANVEQPEINRGREHHENATERTKVRENAESRRPAEPKVAPPKTKTPSKSEKTGRTRNEN